MIKNANDNHPFFINSRRNFSNGRPINTIDDLNTTFKGRTIFIIGAGPSLDNNIGVLGDYMQRDMGIIICTDGAIHDMRRVFLKPDFVISCEADGEHTVDKAVHGYPTTEDLLQTIDIKFYRNVPLIASSWCNSLFVDGWPCAAKYWYVNHFKSSQCDFQFYWNNSPELFPSCDNWPLIESRNIMCGFQAIEISRRLGAKEVVLLGFDMDGDQENHHSKGFTMDWDRSSVILKDHYQKQLKEFTEEFKGDFGIKTYNCTEGGALTEENTTAKVMNLYDFLRENKQ